MGAHQGMAISARTANKIAACVLVSIVTAALAAGYSEITGGRQHYGALVGLQVGLVLSAFELFYVQSPAGVPLRRLPLIAFIGIATLVWASSTAAST